MNQVNKIDNVQEIPWKILKTYKIHISRRKSLTMGTVTNTVFAINTGKLKT